MLTSVQASGSTSSQVESAILGIWGLLEATLGVLFNSLVLTIYYNNHQWNRVQNFYIFQLGLCDFLLSTLVISPLALNLLVKGYDGWIIFGNKGCVVHSCLTYVLLAVYMMLCYVITLDRLCTISFGFSYWSKFLVRNAMYITLVIWGMSVVGGVLLFSYIAAEEQSSPGITPLGDCNTYVDVTKTEMLVVGVLFGFLPVVLITSTAIIIVYKILQLTPGSSRSPSVDLPTPPSKLSTNDDSQRRRVSFAPVKMDDTTELKQQREEIHYGMSSVVTFPRYFRRKTGGRDKIRKRAFVTVTLRLVGFLATWLPFTIAFTLSPTLSPHVTAQTRTICLLILFIKPVLNPWLYASRVPSFRKTYCRLASPVKQSCPDFVATLICYPRKLESNEDSFLGVSANPSKTFGTSFTFSHRDSGRNFVTDEKPSIPSIADTSQ